MTLLERRRMMMESNDNNDYPGWQMGVKCTTTGTAPDAIAATSPMMEVNLVDTERILWMNYFVEDGAAIRGYYVQFFDADKNFLSSLDSNNRASGGYTNRLFVLQAIQKTAKYIRFCVKMDKIDNCYMKDDTRKIYIWKGKNV